MSATRDPRHDPYPGDALRMDAGDIVLVCSINTETEGFIVEWCNGPGRGLLSLASWRHMVAGAEVVRVAPAENIPPAEYVS